MVTFNSSMDSQSPQSDIDQFYNSSPSNPGVPIAAIIAVGFFATSLVITIYYLLVVKFWLNNQHRSSLPENTYNNNNMPPIFFSYDNTQEAHQGVHPSVIGSIPVVTFKKVGEDHEEKSHQKKTKKGISSHECAVCLADFLDKESIKVLPGCSHAFHIDCIDTWLQFNVNCPMCRAVISSASLAIKVDDPTAAELDQTEDDQTARSVRRSFSMDWFAERRIKRGEGSTSGAAVNGETSGRFMRLVHSFRLGRSSRNAVLPIQMEPHD